MQSKRLMLLFRYSGIIIQLTLLNNPFTDKKIDKYEKFIKNRDVAFCLLLGFL
jgi:hypothetical protein